MKLMRLGNGIGWRPELAMHIERRSGLGFIELLAENLMHESQLPPPVKSLQARGIKTLVHGVSLSLGGAYLPCERRLAQLDEFASRAGACLVSEHIAFVRAGGIEAHHLLPVDRNEKSLKIVVENINFAASRLSVPLVVENIAALLENPRNEIDEPTFISRILEETDSMLLLDVSNLYANSRNLDFDPLSYVEKLPLERIAYMHIAGGTTKKGLYHDTHAHSVGSDVFALLGEICKHMDEPSVMLERDDCFPSQKDLFDELDKIELSIKQRAKIHA